MRGLLVVLVPNRAADIARIRQSMGWEPPVIPEGQTRVASWGVWRSTLSESDLQRLRAHASAGECRVMESSSTETHREFLDRYQVERSR